MSEDNIPRYDLAKVLPALALVVAGTLLLVNNLVWHHPVSIGDLWPMVFVLFGAAQLGQARQTWQYVDGGALLLLGLLLLESNIHAFPGLRFRFGSLWPLALIYVGLRVLVWQPWSPQRQAVGKDHFGVAAVFGGGDYRFDSKTLRGGSARAMFGGCTIDFRSADMAGESMIVQCQAALGGIEIRVPSHWNVTVQGVPVLGAIENSASRSAANGVPAKTLIVEGTVFMGAIEIKN